MTTLPFTSEPATPLQNASEVITCAKCVGLLVHEMLTVSPAMGTVYSTMIPAFAVNAPTFADRFRVTVIGASLLAYAISTGISAFVPPLGPVGPAGPCGPGSP